MGGDRGPLVFADPHRPLVVEGAQHPSDGGGGEHRQPADHHRDRARPTRRRWRARRCGSPATARRRRAAPAAATCTPWTSRCRPTVILARPVVEPKVHASDVPSRDRRRRRHDPVARPQPDRARRGQQDRRGRSDAIGELPAAPAWSPATRRVGGGRGARPSRSRRPAVQHERRDRRRASTARLRQADDGSARPPPIGAPAGHTGDHSVRRRAGCAGHRSDGPSPRHRRVTVWWASGVDPPFGPSAMSPIGSGETRVSPMASTEDRPYGRPVEPCPAFAYHPAAVAPAP